MSLPTIYVAGPYSNAPDQNVRLTIAYAVDLIHRGWSPFVPHLYHFIDEQLRANDCTTISYEAWMAMDFAFVEKCDALLKVADSPGADREEELAKRLGKPVFKSLDTTPHGSVFLWEQRTNYGPSPFARESNGPCNKSLYAKG